MNNKNIVPRMPPAARSFRTVSEAAAQLSCSRHQITKLVDAGKLELVRLGNKSIRVTQRSLDAYIDELLTEPGRPQAEDEQR